MGYTTRFKGSLLFVTKPTVDQIAALSTMFEDSWQRGVEGAPGYLQFKVTKKMDGIEWDGNEKFYESIACVNFVVDKMRETWPDFGLTGEMEAQGDDLDDHWYLRIEKGVAVKVPIAPKGIKVKCPECRHSFRIETAG